KYTTPEMIYVTSNTSIGFEATDDSGVGATYYRINGSAWQEYTSPFSLNGSDGVYVIEYYSVDIYGNAESVKSATLYLDNTPPETSVTYVADVHQVVLNATDEGCGVKSTFYRVDGGEWQEYTGPIELEPGPHTIEYYSVDYLDNMESVKSFNISVPTTAPPTPLHPMLLLAAAILVAPLARRICQK
ncbi:MAG: hypothetical protein DRJ56_06525, partial [Thermoprotei archaeon]